MSHVLRESQVSQASRVSQAVQVREASEAGLVVRGLGKRFTAAGREIAALEDISLSAATGEFVTIIGPSGCGKTTLLCRSPQVRAAFQRVSPVQGYRCCPPATARAVRCVRIWRLRLAKFQAPRPGKHREPQHRQGRWRRLMAPYLAELVAPFGRRIGTLSSP